MFYSLNSRPKASWWPRSSVYTHPTHYVVILRDCFASLKLLFRRHKGYPAYKGILHQQSLKGRLQLRFDFDSTAIRRRKTVEQPSNQSRISVVTTDVLHYIGRKSSDSTRFSVRSKQSERIIIPSCARGDTICPRPFPPSRAAEQTQRSSTFPTPNTFPR